MIKSFADKETERLWRGRKSKAVPEDVRERAVAKLVSINAATSVEELRVPPGNRLHKLGGDREGCWSISINQQHRACFVFEGGDAYEVEIVDYH
ncbi:MAG: type II toxin-antitoxin system RelE/ParE family toxin [Rubrobacter sp.]|nr:type II toxin-antitoxin system RelE/ParE family toxin [Rubrobacter sp.]